MKTFQFKHLLIALAALFFLSGSKSADKKIDLSGTWQICSQDFKIETKLSGREGATRYLIINENTIVIVEANLTDKTFVAPFVGTFTIDGNTSTEHLILTNPGLKSYQDKFLNYQIELKDGFLIKKGTNNPYNEIWKKIDL